MKILFGHPSGNPNSHQAALAYWEAGLLESFCVPWVPQEWELDILRRLPGFGGWVDRLERRRARELRGVPKVEGRLGEWFRMIRRIAGWRAAGVADEANRWLMDTMRRRCGRGSVGAVHSYEDCSQSVFEEARRLGKPCIYDLPVAYVDSLRTLKRNLSARYRNWMEEDWTEQEINVARKSRELSLADLVLVPSQFAAKQLEGRTSAPVKVVQFGVDFGFWGAGSDEVFGGVENVEFGRKRNGPLQFLYVGHCSVWKGLPMLLAAWREAAVRDAELVLVGGWCMRSARRAGLPRGVRMREPVSARELRRIYHSSDVLVFPSHFEGFGLVILEAMAAGLPVISTDATAAPDLLDSESGKVVPSGDVDALVAALRWMGENRSRVREMGEAAKRRAEHFGWDRYRKGLVEAVSGFCHG
jgi:starch synthase